MAKIIQNNNGAKAFAGKANKAKGVKEKEIVVAKNLDDVVPAEEDVVVSDGAGQTPGEGRIVLAQANTAASAGGAGGAAAPAEAGAAGTVTAVEAGTTVSAAAAGGVVGGAAAAAGEAVGGAAAISGGMMALVGVGLAAVAVGVAAGSNSDSTPAAAPAAAADTIAPAAPLALDLAAADDSGSLNTDNITRNTTGLTISGTAEAGSTVRIYDTDGTTLLGTGTATNGTFTIDVSLAAGDHTLTAKATDAAGNASGASVGLSVTVDTTAPVIQSMTSAGNQVVLTYDSPLDAANIPVAGDFAVTVGGAPNAVTNVAVAGVTVTLTLTAAVVAGDAVQVTYTDPTAGDDAAAIQDVAGNDGVGFTSGVVADGYVHGAQIYIDTDNDGVADPGEAVAGVVTDAAGNFFLPAGSPAGTIIAVGGVNDSGLPNTISLKAPTGSTMVTPLTTLVQAYIEANAGTTVADASAAIVTALSLPGGTDLTTYDPIAVLATAPADATALAVQKAAVQVATVVALAAAAPITVTGEQAAITVVENLVTQMGAPTAITPIDLTAGAVITTALGAVSSAALADITTATTAIDGAANLSQVALAQSVALDTYVPSAPTLIDLVAGSDTGSSTTDNITNDTTPTIRVSFDAAATDGTAAAAGDTVTVLDGAVTVGTAILTATNIANGYVDVTLSTLTGEGAHPLTATLTDIADNASDASTGLAITLDTTIATPTVALTTDSGSSAADSLTNSAALTFSTAAGDVSRTYTVDGGPVGGSYTAPTANGSHTVTVIDTDTAGNTASASTTFTLDTTIATPTVALTTNSGSTSDTITNSAALTFSTAAGDVSRTYTVDGGSPSGSYTAPTADGAHTVTVIDTDTAGNTASASTTFTLDTTIAAPTVALTTDSGAADGITNIGTLNVTGTETGATVQYSTDGGTNWSGSFTAAEGANSVQVRQTDVAGNTSTVTAIEFTLDTTIATPTMALTTNSGSTSDTITNSAALDFSAAAADVIRTYTVDSGTASGSYTAPTADGAHTVTVIDTDTAGNTASASTTFTLDTAAPTLSSTTPADGAVDVVGNSIVLTFAEAVAAGTGNIILNDGTTPTNIPVTDSQVAISGNTVTITPTLSPNTNYAVTIGSGVITDVAGNAFAGIASGALDFTMADNPSVTVTTSEADNLLNIGDTAAITFTLSEASSNFTAADVTVTGGTLSNFSGSGTTYAATLTPTTNSTTGATVSVGAGVFTNANNLGNIASSTLNLTVDTVAPATPTVALTTNSGSTSDTITNSAALTFSTAAGDVTRTYTVDSGTPGASYTAPTTDGAHTVTVIDIDTAGNTASASTTFTLDTTIATPTVALTTNSGSTSDSITNSAALTFSTAATDVTRTYTVDSGTAGGSYTAPTTNGAHTVTVTDTDTAGNTANASTTFTLDTVAPTLSSSTPADNAIGVPPSGNIVLTFSENVAAGTGNIVVSDGTNSTTIPVADTSQVTFSGTTVTINPTDDASPSTSYYVQLAGGVITDTAGNAYAGIADTTTLNFTTAAAPTITSSLDNVTNFEVTSNIVLSASENVTAVAGKYITIINDGGAGFHGEATVNTQQILVTDTSKVTITNDTITINPGFDLDFANDYHIMVDSGAFLGVTSGQGSVATADAAAMNFSTVTPSATATAAGSQMMASGTDAMVAGHNWWDAEGNGSPATSAVARDFSGGDYAVTANDLATTGIATNDFYIAVNNFGTGDLIYFDNHGDNAVQRQTDFDAGMIIDFGTPPTVISAAASGTATGTNGGQFDVTLEGALAGDTFSDTATLQSLLNVSYQPILYG